MAVFISYGNSPPVLIPLDGTVSLQVATNAGGVIAASSSNPSAVRVSPSSLPGPTATFTLTGFGVGTAVVSFTDRSGAVATIGVSVSGPLLVSDVTPGGPGSQPYALLQASDPGYSGPLTPVCGPSSAGTISGPGTVLFAGTGPSQNGPGPVQWIVVPAAGITNLTVDVFDLLGTEASQSLSFTPSTALPPGYAITFLDFLGLSGIAAGFRWTIRLAGLPIGTSIPPVDTGYTGIGGTVQSSELLADSEYEIIFEGNGAPPTPVTFLTAPAGSISQAVQILDYAAPMRGISEDGYTQELLAAYPLRWLSETGQAPGGNAYALTYALAGVLWFNDLLTETFRLGERAETASGDGLVSWAADYFPPELPLPKLRFETDDSYRTRLYSILAGNVATIDNLQSVLQTYEDALRQNGQIVVFDQRSSPGAAAQIAGVGTGVFVVQIDYPDTADPLSLYLDFGFLDYSYIGNNHPTDFFLDNDFLDWNFMLPIQGDLVQLPIFDSYLDGIVRREKAGGRVAIYAGVYW